MSFTIGERIRLVHGKPWKRTFSVTGTVRAFDAGRVVIGRTFSAGGTYDSIGAPRLLGDHGTVELAEGGRVLRREYRRTDGELIGELFNIQTPAQFGPHEITYTDLEVDVVRLPDGSVTVVDEEDLAQAIRDGHIPPAVGEDARALAYRLAAVLRAGGDWRTVES